MSIGAALEPTEPSEALRQKTLGALSLDGRFERFAAQAGRLLDLGEDDARTVLNRIDQPADWYGDPKVGPTAMLWIEGGPAGKSGVSARSPSVGGPFSSSTRTSSGVWRFFIRGAVRLTRRPVIVRSGDFGSSSRARASRISAARLMSFF